MVTTDGARFGPCCACNGGGHTVRNIVLLEVKGPVPGTGWGCVECGLAQDGAVAVLCDACADAGAAPLYVCVGNLTDGVRTDVSACTEPHQHRRDLHPEIAGGGEGQR